MLPAALMNGRASTFNATSIFGPAVGLGGRVVACVRILPHDVSETIIETCFFSLGPSARWSEIVSSTRTLLRVGKRYPSPLDGVVASALDGVVAAGVCVVDDEVVWPSWARAVPAASVRTISGTAMRCMAIPLSVS